MTEVRRLPTPGAQGSEPSDACALGVVIHGVSRSGTSAVAGLFVASGYYAGGEDDLMRANSGNPAGYYENLNVYKANEDVLAELGGTWFDPPTDRSQLVAPPSVSERLRHVFDQLLKQADGAPVALKDPRIQVMMALWEPIIGAQLHPLMVVRDPIEVARSLLARDGTPMALGLAAWELHTTCLLRALAGAEVTVAPYRVLLGSGDEARSIVEAASGYLRADLAARVQASDGGGWLTERLAHNEVASGEHERYLTRPQVELWEWLAALPAGTSRLQPPPALLAEDPAARAGTSAEAARTRLIADHAARGEELAALSAAKVQTEAQLEAATARADALSRELQAERDHAAREAERAEVAQIAHDNLLRSLEAITQSTSWRATKPFRAAGRAARGSRRSPEST